MQTSKYTSKQADESGFIRYTDDEHAIWHELYTQQINNIAHYACPEYIQGVRDLDLPKDRVPQLKEVSDVLLECTGWQVSAVPALISYNRFFDLLANRKFPAATFIRRREEMEYLQEPDIFHEIFGHCPLLTNPVYANFMEAYGQIGLHANSKDQALLARIYWFTVEFGLIKSNEDHKCYGAGLLSSFGETVYSVESDIPERRPFDLINILRTPYRIDIYQTVYYVITSFEQLYQLVKYDLIDCLNKARKLKEFEPTFPPKS